MTSDLWADFSNSITTYLNENTTVQEIYDNNSLNKQWHQLNQAITKAAKKIIPRAKIQPRTFYTFSSKATKLHLALKCINKLIRQIETNAQTPTSNLIQAYNKDIDFINNKTSIQINYIILNNLLPTNKKTLIIQIKAQQKTIHQAKKLENNLAHQSTINKYISKRHSDFNDNTTYMINSILKRHTDPVILHNICKQNEVITEPELIRREVQTHYENWTKLNLPNWSHWEEWKEEYNPISKIQEHWYKDISDPITLEELTSTIKKAPNCKATGPHDISNEMLKHLGDNSLRQLCKILNACITLNTIPKT
jgi:hypothetical protein